MNMLAETTGAFMLSDMYTGQVIQAHRPSVIKRSGFIDARIALGQITKLADLPDDATDDDFASFWKDSDGDQELAVASYLSQFGDKPAPKKKAK